MTDFYACDSLRAWRARLGMPFAAFLELHGSYVFLSLLPESRRPMNAAFMKRRG